MTTELTAAPALILQSPADALMGQISAGLLTQAEYDAACPPAPAPVCLYCTAPATHGKTCPTHADRATIAITARTSRPTVNVARYSTRTAFTAAVIAALEQSGRVQAARRFAVRAGQARGMNGVCQIAGEYVRVERRVV